MEEDRHTDTVTMYPYIVKIGEGTQIRDLISRYEYGVSIFMNIPNDNIRPLT